MDGSYLYQPDGTKVSVQSYMVAIPYLNRIENDVHGVTSWSRHPEEAMQLLSLVNTDEELANLLYFGEEGRDYQLKDGKAYPETHTDTYCPANPKITHFSLYEAKGTEKKETYYKKVNEKYKISPADGFVPDLKKAGAGDKLLNRVETFYKTLLEGEDDPEEMIRKFQKKLKKQNYENILKSIQCQYDKWKKRGGKNEK
jgi:putative aldouronate transport system substrate-binding protein